MQQLQHDKRQGKGVLTLEDWTEHEVRKPFRVATVIQTKPNFGKRIAFGFDKLEEARAAYEALYLGLKNPADYKRLLMDQSMAAYL